MSCYFYILLLPVGPECSVISLYFMCFSVNGSVCLVRCLFYNVLYCIDRVYIEFQRMCM